MVDADLGLHGGDLRAAERTYQLMQQVAGRAGRGEKPGRVYLQTYDPDRAVMEALKSGDRETFMAAEAEDRRLSGMPPYGRLAALIISGHDRRRHGQGPGTGAQGAASRRRHRCWDRHPRRSPCCAGATASASS